MSWFIFKKPHSSYWIARIKAGGRSFDRSTKTRNRRTAERVAEKLERDALLSGNPVTLQKALSMLYEHQVDKGDSKHTLERTDYSARHLCTFFGKNTDVREIQLPETTKYMRHRREHVKDSTIYRELRTYREALVNLKRHKLYDGEPSMIWPASLPQTFAGKSRWLPELEVVKLLDALPEFWRDYVVVYVYAGLRRSELFALTAEHVDFERDRLHAPGTKTEGADRWLPMHPMVSAVLKRRCEWVSGFVRHRLRDGTTTKSPPSSVPAKPLSSTDSRERPALFPVGDRTPHKEARRMSSAIKRAAKAAGIDHCSPNDLRRTFCSWCYQSGVSESDCARWLGHKNSAMVRSVYGHDSAENAARKIRAVPSLAVKPEMKNEEMN